MNIVFSEKLKELRIAAGLTQTGLAEKLTAFGASENITVSDKVVWKWESGNGYPEIPTLLLIAKFFRESIDYILTGTDMAKDLMLSLKHRSENLHAEFEEEQKSLEPMTYSLKDGKLEIKLKPNMPCLEMVLEFLKPDGKRNRTISSVKINSDILLNIPKDTDAFIFTYTTAKEPDIEVRSKAYSLSTLK